MSVARSRFARPVSPGAAGVRTVGWWGMVIAIVLFVHLVGGFLVAALYLRSGQAAWPPAGIDAPPVLRPAVAAGLAVLAAVVMHASLRRVRRQDDAADGPGHLPGLLVTTLLGVGSVAALVWSYADVGVRWDEHAYGSVLWVLGWVQGLVVASTTIGTVVLAVQAGRRILAGGHDDEAEVLVLGWWFAAVTSVAVLVVAHALGRW